MVDQENLGHGQQRRATGWSLTLPYVVVCNARRAVVAAGVVLLGMVAGTSARAQDTTAARARDTAAAPVKKATPVVVDPVIHSLKLDGDKNISEDELRAAMQTEPSHCKGIPNYCRILPYDLLRTRVRLDRDELDRDMLRLRVLYWKRGWRASQVVPTIRPRSPSG